MMKICKPLPYLFLILGLFTLTICAPSFYKSFREINLFVSEQIQINPVLSYFIPLYKDSMASEMKTVIGQTNLG